MLIKYLILFIDLEILVNILIHVKVIYENLKTIILNFDANCFNKMYWSDTEFTDQQTKFESLFLKYADLHTVFTIFY